MVVRWRGRVVERCRSGIGRLDFLDLLRKGDERCGERVRRENRPRIADGTKRG